MEFAEEKHSRILFVDDDVETQKCFSVLFSSPALKHCRVDFSSSANEAMAMIVMNLYDLCILDWNLGGSTAKDLVNEWRGCGYSLPFMVVSGDSTTAADAIELGASTFLDKLDASRPSVMDKAIKTALRSYWHARCE